jgi:hypothetical protein
VITNDFETFWLTATNIVLGLVTLVCCGVFAHGLILEVKARLASRRAKVVIPSDDHAFVVPALGLTMADGGERLDANEEKPTNGKEIPPAK